MYVIMAMHENYAEAAYVAPNWEEVELFFAQTTHEWYGDFPDEPVKDVLFLTEEEGHGFAIYKPTVLGPG